MNSLRTRSKARCLVTSRSTITAPTLPPSLTCTGVSAQASRRVSPSRSICRSAGGSLSSSPASTWCNASSTA